MLLTWPLFKHKFRWVISAIASLPVYLHFLPHLLLYRIFFFSYQHHPSFFWWENTDTLIVQASFFEIWDSKSPRVITSQVYYELPTGSKVENRPSSFLVQLNLKPLESDHTLHSLQSFQESGNGHSPAGWLICLETFQARTGPDLSN